MAADIAIKGTVSEEREQSKFICYAEPRKRGCDAINADIEVIKHRIYEVRGLNLKSQFVTSNVDNLTKGVEFDHLFMANPSKSMGLQIKQQR